MKVLYVYSWVLAATVLAVAFPVRGQRADGDASIRVGTVGLTKAYVSENHVRQRMGPEIARGVNVAQMSEAALYRALMDGKLDMGSVLALPGDVGVANFEKAFRTPPRVATLGYLAVTACTSSKRSLSGLTIEQIGQIVSGEITDWRQLGAGEGKISVITDQRAIALVATLTGVQPAEKLRKIDEGLKALALLGEGQSGLLVVTSSKLHEVDLSRMSDVALLPVAAGADDKPVAPSLKTIQDGSYPLARPWRLILRPGASPAAEKVVALLADVEKGSDFDPWLRLWLVPPAASPIRNHIRVGSMGWQRELAAAAKAYQQKHPEVTFTFSNDYLDVPGRLLRGEIDLANYTGEFGGHIGGADVKTFGEGFPEPSIERTVGYWPFAVAVHPASSLDSITLPQLHKVLYGGGARWTDLGRKTDGRICVYLKYADELSPIIKASVVAERSDSTTGERVDVTIRRLSGRDLPDLAHDSDGIALLHHDRTLAASGYKILSVGKGEQEKVYQPTDPRAVASGAYPLRTSLNVMAKASAPKHVREFLAWLVTADAAEAFKSGAEERAATCWPVAHVSEAAEVESPAAVSRPADATPAAGIVGEPIAGAVAVLPTEPLSLLFRMADRSHYTAYEQAIGDAIAADGRLKIVDRGQIARVLAERRLQILGLDNAGVGAIVSADVLVVSHTVTEDLKTFLRVRAFHGATAGLLGELKLPINPADPATFDPPLGQAVGRWWPGVLERLRDSRHKPSWVVLDVYPSSLESLDHAASLHKALRETLVANRSIVSPGDAGLEEAQQEILLRLLGLALPSSGKFTPMADFLVDARLLAPDRLEMRVRNAALGTVAQGVLSGDGETLAAAARQWVQRQIDRRHSRPVAKAPQDAVDDWARQQAQVELDMSRQLRQRARTLYAHSPADRFNDPQVQRLRLAAKKHARRAAQLDPTNEEAAYEALPSLDDLVMGWVIGADNVPLPSQIIGPVERFMDSFPRSKRLPDVLVLHANTCTFFATKAALPRGADERAIRLACWRKALADHKRYIERYGTPQPKGSVLTFRGYLQCLQGYLDFAKPEPEEIGVIVTGWSKQFDQDKDKVCHSDFLRLVALKHNKDRAGFIDLLTAMQHRWPDPKHLQWAQTAGVVDGLIFSLFQGVSSSNSSFQLWSRGLRGVGDIPKVGYKLADDEVKFGNVMLLLVFPGEAASLKDAFRKVGEVYRKTQPNVRLMLMSSATVLEAVEKERGLVVVVGDVPADQMKALGEIYRSEKLPLRPLGLTWQASSETQARPVSLLMRPGDKSNGDGLLLDDFLRFMKTPAGREALAGHNVRFATEAPAALAADRIAVKQPASAASNE